jgi:hypothetical protein
MSRPECNARFQGLGHLSPEDVEPRTQRVPLTAVGRAALAVADTLEAGRLRQGQQSLP